MGTYKGPIQLIIDKGRLTVIAQDDYDYVRIRVSSTRLSEVLRLEAAYGGTRYATHDSFIWTASKVESLRQVCADIAEHVELKTRMIRDVLEIVTLYCSSMRGGPRTYTARTLNGLLGGESKAFIDML